MSQADPQSPSPARQAMLPPETIRRPGVEQFLLGGSRHAGEPWRIHVAGPQGVPPATGCRVVYLLDGNASFPLAWHALRALEASHPALPARQTVLVGIGYPADVRFDVQRRFFDLTPPTAKTFMRGRDTTRTGGQDEFLDFIEHDLRPAIARRVPVDPLQQALFGHSLGGLLTLHALYTRAHLFQSWFAADPSLWWNGGSILQEEAAFLAGIRFAGNRLAQPMRLLVARSSGERRSGGAATQTRDGTTNGAAASSRASMPDAQESARRLAAVQGLEVRYHRYADESHPSMLGPSIRDALSFFLGLAPAHFQRL